jgi:hypothetical protein
MYTFAAPGTFTESRPLSVRVRPSRVLGLDDFFGSTLGFSISLKSSSVEDFEGLAAGGSLFGGAIVGFGTCGTTVVVALGTTVPTSPQQLATSPQHGSQVEHVPQQPQPPHPVRYHL